MGYAGSEEFIRLQFEEYLLALLSCVSLSIDRESKPLSDTTNNGRSASTDRSGEPNPIGDFNVEFISAWKLTSNFALFARLTAGFPLYDIVEPRHPTAGGLSVEDVQRRLAQQVAELHLDERVREGREILNKNLNFGREKVGQGINKLWADIEAMREAQRGRSSSEKDTTASIRAIEGDLTSHGGKEDMGIESTQAAGAHDWSNNFKERASKVQRPDMSQVQASAKDGAARAGAYLSSWGSWAKERSKEWQEKRSPSPAAGAP